MAKYISLNRTQVRVVPPSLYLFEVAAALETTYQRAYQAAKNDGVIFENRGLYCVDIKWVEAQIGLIGLEDFIEIAKKAKVLSIANAQRRKLYPRGSSSVPEPTPAPTPEFGTSPAAAALPAIRELNARTAEIIKRPTKRVVLQTVYRMPAWAVSALTALGLGALAELAYIVMPHVGR